MRKNDQFESMYTKLQLIMQQESAATKAAGLYKKERIGFYYPVVPQSKAGIRVQLSATHEKEHLDKAIAAFTKTGKELEMIR